jgi:hypothetical protein
MKRTTLYCMMILGAALAGNAEAIYKCTTAKGVVYQDRPCREGAESDVQIVIPTGEIAPNSVAAPNDAAPANASGPKVENHFGAPRTGRAPADEPATSNRASDRKMNQANTRTGDESRKKDARAADTSGTPMTADQAQKTEATAKYFTTDAAAPGFEAPQQMTCESPSGEKRIFILTNGKLTSI